MADLVEFDTGTTLELRFFEPVFGRVTSGATVPSSTSFLTTLTDSSDDTYNGDFLEFLEGPAKGVLTQVTDYTGASKLVTVGETGLTPKAGDSFKISHLLDLTSYTAKLRWWLGDGVINVDSMTISSPTTGIATYKFLDTELVGQTLTAEASIYDASQLVTTTLDRLTFVIRSRAV